MGIGNRSVKTAFLNTAQAPAFLAMATLAVLVGCGKPTGGPLAPTAPTSAIEISQRAADGERAFAEIPAVPIQAGSPLPDATTPSEILGATNSIPPTLSAKLDGKWSVSYQQNGNPR
jgi:hypothetical protein